MSRRKSRTQCCQLFVRNQIYALTFICEMSLMRSPRCSLLEMVKVAQKPENAAQHVVGPIFHSSAWRTSLTMRLAGLVDRGTAARSTRAELLDD